MCFNDRSRANKILIISMLYYTDHKSTQKMLLKMLPKALGEYRFKKINRIADVFCPEQKLVFEIQYSPITLKEAFQRTLDYQYAGCEIIWILHENHFNKRFASKSELFIRKNISYFTSINRFGIGIIYDQIEFFRHNERVYKGNPIKVNPPFLTTTNTYKLQSAPKKIFNKYRNAIFYFSSDLLDQSEDKKKRKEIKKLSKMFTWKFSITQTVNFFLDSFLKSLSSTQNSLIHTPSVKKNIDQ